MSIFDFIFKRKQEDFALENFILADMHSHLLPGIDDGAVSIEESLDLIKGLAEMGYKKLITTPHIMGDFYKNTPEVIREKLAYVRSAVKKENLDISIDAAAEYYLDEWFVNKLENNEELLTFGNKFLLFETSFMNPPAQLNETIFQISARGLKPVLAHPERYVYMFDNFQKYEELREKGVLFQINLNSLTGYYSKPSQKIAEKLLKKGMVDFAGTDCHGDRHLASLIALKNSNSYQKLASVNLLNNSLLR
jgi:tyrosine-protein phosphatase YwqE